MPKCPTCLQETKPDHSFPQVIYYDETLLISYLVSIVTCTNMKCKEFGQSLVWWNELLEAV
jgi:hypothetical protein